MYPFKGVPGLKKDENPWPGPSFLKMGPDGEHLNALTESTLKSTPILALDSLEQDLPLSPFPNSNITPTKDRTKILYESDCDPKSRIVPFKNWLQILLEKLAGFRSNAILSGGVQFDYKPLAQLLCFPPPCPFMNPNSTQSHMVAALSEHCSWGAS